MNIKSILATCGCTAVVSAATITGLAPSSTAPAHASGSGDSDTTDTYVQPNVPAATLGSTVTQAPVTADPVTTGVETTMATVKVKATAAPTCNVYAQCP